MKKIFPHIFVAIMFICLIILGTWQVQRRAEKQNMIQEIAAHINTAPLSPNTYKNIVEDEFKKMNVSGKYLHDKEFLLLNKRFNGKPGQHIITPIKISSGEVILVDRGWVSTDKPDNKPQGQQNITALVMSKQKLNMMAKLIVMENIPQKQIWFWMDLSSMYKTLNLPEKDYYLLLIDPEATKACVEKKNPSLGEIADSDTQDCKYKPTSYPYAQPAKIEVYNEHMVYIITWYSLSIVLLLIYYFRFWKK